MDEIWTRLWDLDYPSSDHDTHAQTFRQRILEAFRVGNVKVVHQDRVAFLSDQSFCRLSQKGGDVMSDRSDLIK